jgi:hypothetical protein
VAANFSSKHTFTWSSGATSVFGRSFRSIPCRTASDGSEALCAFRCSDRSGSR